MVLIFLISCVYALIHFIFEGIIAPSSRMTLRFDLFALRDELRRLKIANPELSNEAFEVIQDALNGAIKHLYDIDVPMLAYCDYVVNSDADLKERVKSRRAAVLNANSDALINMANQINKKIKSAAIINSGGWLFYLIPIAIAVVSFRFVCRPIFSILYIPKYELGKIMPEKELIAVPI